MQCNYFILYFIFCFKFLESEKPNGIDLTTTNNSKKENVNHTQITADCEKPKLKEKLKKNKRMVTIVKGKNNTLVNHMCLCILNILRRTVPL